MAKFRDITGAKSKTFHLGFTISQIKTSNSSWPNRMGRCGQIGWVAAAELKTVQLAFIIVKSTILAWPSRRLQDSPTHLHHDRIKDGISTDSKILRLGFVMAKLKVSSLSGRRLSDLVLPWPSRRRSHN